MLASQHAQETTLRPLRFPQNVELMLTDMLANAFADEIAEGRAR